MQVLDEWLMNKAIPVPESGCWLWAGGTAKGYGVTWGPDRAAHRVAYRMAYGDIPAGLSICHKCDVPSCVNPAHMFLGDNSANMRDASAKKRIWQMKKTHCPKGHPYDEKNTMSPKDGRSHRKCRECRNERERIRYWRERAQ